MKATTLSVLLSLLTIIFLSPVLSAITLQNGQTMRERVLSEDFPTAQKALEENRKRKDIQAICLSLENPLPGIKRQAAEALKILKDKAATRCLVKALENNQF